MNKFKEMIRRMSDEDLERFTELNREMLKLGITPQIYEKMMEITNEMESIRNKYNI